MNGDVFWSFVLSVEPRTPDWLVSEGNALFSYYPEQRPHDRMSPLRLIQPRPRKEHCLSASAVSRKTTNFFCFITELSRSVRRVPNIHKILTYPTCPERRSATSVISYYNRSPLLSGNRIPCFVEIVNKGRKENGQIIYSLSVSFSLSVSGASPRSFCSLRNCAGRTPYFCLFAACQERSDDLFRILPDLAGAYSKIVGVVAEILPNRFRSPSPPFTMNLQFKSKVSD